MRVWNAERNERTWRILNIAKLSTYTTRACIAMSAELANCSASMHLSDLRSLRRVPTRGVRESAT